MFRQQNHAVSGYECTRKMYVDNVRHIRQLPRTIYVSIHWRYLDIFRYSTKPPERHNNGERYANKRSVLREKERIRISCQKHRCHGTLIDDQGSKASPEKIARIEAWTTPRKKKQLQKFLGVLDYISQFIPHLASITPPLTWLTGTEEFVWTAAHAHDMENVKQAAAHNQIMKPIEQELALPILLITNTEDTGVGAWVLQGETADTARPAGLHSRKFSNAQKNNGTTAKEALSIVDALTAFHHLLARNEFTIVTYQQPLMYLKTSKTLTKKQLKWRGYIE